MVSIPVLLVTVLAVTSGTIISESQRLRFESYAMSKRISLLGDRLADECPHLYKSDVFGGKRQVLNDGDFAEKLRIEQKVVNHLVQMLQRCRFQTTTRTTRRTMSPTHSRTRRPTTRRMTIYTTPYPMYNITISYENLTNSSNPSQCNSSDTVSLSDSWRNHYKGSDLENDDIKILFPHKTWFRFTDEAGTKIRDTCPTQFECGSSGAYWSNDTMPYMVGVTKVIRLYESYRDEDDDIYDRSCTQNTVIEALATRCSEKGHFVYQLLEPFDSEDDTVCGMS